MGDSEITESRVVVGGMPTRMLEVAGEGPAVLLLHGFTDSADSWRPVLREFAARSLRAVAVPACPGCCGWFPACCLRRLRHCPQVQVPAEIAGLIADAAQAHADVNSEAPAASGLPSRGLRDETGNSNTNTRAGDVSDRG